MLREERTVAFSSITSLAQKNQWRSFRKLINAVRTSDIVLVILEQAFRVPIHNKCVLSFSMLITFSVHIRKENKNSWKETVPAFISRSCICSGLKIIRKCPWMEFVTLASTIQAKTNQMREAETNRVSLRYFNYFEIPAQTFQSCLTTNWAKLRFFHWVCLN